MGREAKTRAAAAALALGLLWCPAAWAAGPSRDNPFLPDATAEEDARISARNDAAAAVRELMPEVTAEVGRSVGHDQKEAMDLLRDQMNAQMAAQAAQAAQAAKTQVASSQALGSLRSSAGPNVANMKFYACADGKALYKDAAGALVVSPPAEPDQPSPCR